MIILALVVAAAATPATAAQGPGDTGGIDGVATISPRLSAQRARVRVYSEPGPASARPAGDGHAFQNVVMYLESVPGARGSGGAESPVIRQRGERFEPHVLAVTAGATVSFPNDDPIYHNVFSLSRARTFDLGRYPRGETKSVRFDRPGVVQVFCHLHADMRAFVLVLENRFHTVPAADGRFTFEGVPAGEYQLVVWHERIRPLRIPVRVTAGGRTPLAVRIPLPESEDTR